MEYLNIINKRYLLLILIYFSGGHFLSSQTFQDPRDCGFSCSASDLIIEQVFLGVDDAGTPYEGSCVIGVTESVYACFTITNTTNSRRSATILGLTITQNDIFQEDVITCFPQVLSGKTTYTFCTPINYTCGTDLKIANGLVGWSANGKGDCPFDGQTCNDSPSYIPPGKCIENISIDIMEPLIVSFSSNCSGTNSINFTNQSVGGNAPINYSWNFGDGNTSTLENPNHTYAIDGVYSVTFTVTDADNVVRMQTLDVDVSTCNCPDNNIVGTNVSTCKGESLNLNDYITGTINGTLNYSSTLGNWSTNNLITPSSSTTYFVRDSSISTNCVDTARIIVTVLDTFQTQISQPICNGDAFDFNGFSITESGVYRDTLMAANGCDSFIVLTLNVLDTFQTEISETISEGENLPFNNQNLSEQGTFRDTLSAANGCDSFIVLTLTVLDTFQTQITETICQGETLNFNNQDLSQSGIYRDTLAAVTNADSFIVLTLNVLDTFQTQISETIFEGANLPFNNQNLSEQGTFRDTLAAQNGCDSFIVLTITVLDTFQTQINETICQGETLNFNNQDLSQSGIYRDTLAAVTNADSFIVLTLNVLDTFQTQISETIFEGANFSFNNQNLSKQGTFRDTLSAANGCDSFIVLTLTVLDTFQTQITETICQGETLNFNNQDLSQSGVYRDTLAAVTNADSFIVLTLNVLDTFQTQISETIFEGENLPFNNQNLSEQGTFRDTLAAANGCDSFIVLTLTVLDTFQTQITETICQGETLNFNNQDLSQSGIYRDTLAAVTNADSFIVLTLNVLDTFQTQISETIFEGANFSFNNQNLSEQGTFRDTLNAQNGCDSFIVLTITVLDTFQTQITETICQGETLNFNNQDLSQSGIYRDTLAAVTNADSFIVLTLNVLDTFQTQISETIFEGANLPFNNQNLSEQGTFRDTLNAQNGCDSFIVLTLTVLDTFQTQITETICQGETLNFNNQDLSQSGIYRDTLAAVTNADSFIVLTLNVLDTFQTQISETIFEGENLPFNNQNLSKQGTFRDTLSAANGCDSFIVLTLTVLDTFQTQITETICQGETLNFNNQNLSESGVYRDTLAAVTNADSLLF